MNRPTFDQIRLHMIEVLGQRSTCDRGRVAAIITKNNRIISEGYAGAPPGLSHCDDEDHLMEKRVFSGITSTHCIRTTHAEANAIAQAARMGHATEGATIYVTTTPCRDCTKLLISAGIIKVVVLRDYHSSTLSKEWLKKAGISLQIVDCFDTFYK